MTLNLAPGDVYGRLTVMAVDRQRISVVCACGKTRVVAKHNLKSGATTSCGCWMREVVGRRLKGIAPLPGKMKALRDSLERKRAEDTVLRERLSAVAVAVCRARGGTSQGGKSAKGEANKSAKWWFFVHDSGRVLEGFSLYELVRANAHLFDPADVVFRKSQYGADLYCRAERGLRSLYASHEHRKPSWKGWRKPQ